MAAAHAGVGTDLPLGRHRANGPVDERDHRIPTRRRKLPRGRDGRRFDAAGGLLGDARRRAVGEHDLGQPAVRVDLRKQLEGCNAAADDAQGQEEKPNGQSDCRKAVVDGEVEDGRIDPAHEPFEPPVAGPLQEGHDGQQEPQRIENHAQDREQKVLLVGQMAGQDEYGLEQRHQERADEGEGHHRNEFAHHTRDKTERQERDHGRQHARDHARNHFDRAVDRRLHQGLTHPPMPLDVVADHDRIINHDSNRHQEGEHRKHVECLIGREHQHPRPQHRERDAQGHPEGDFEIEEQGQHHEHDQQALQAIRDKHVEPVANVD